jgi:thiamine transport system substrate-binding protein
VKKYRLLFLLGVSLFVLAACTPAAATTTVTPSIAATAEPATLTVMTHDSFSVTEDLVRQFEQENNVKIVFAKSGDTGAALNLAVLSKDAPRADVFYGVDNTFLSRALDAGIFEAYDSPLLAEIPAEFKLDPSKNALPVDFGDVCINYDKAYFSERGLAVPASLADLLKPEYKGLLVTENPATSSPGLAFVMASVAQYGPDRYLEFWQGMKDNGLVVVNDWETAYYTNFSGSSGKGSQPMVVSYGSSPAAEVVFADPPREDAPTASIVGDNTCFRQIEFVGILKGTQQRKLAEKFVDFMLGVKFQEDMPLQMFVFPVNSQAKLPEVFTKNVQVPNKPATLDPAEIGANREAWINAWTETVLR